MKLIKAAVLATAIIVAGGNTKADWNTTVVQENHGHRIGNPKAKHVLTEYISYTCSHCAQFAQEGDRVLKLAYIHNGNTAVEIRHLLRDPIDLTAAMLTHCGDTRKFALNHNAFMFSQSKWLPVAQRATEAQMARWNNKDRKAARRTIASDFGFYQIMQNRGYGITQIDRCLNDDAKAEALVTTSRDDAIRTGVRSTPSFLLDGNLLEGVHNWAALKPVLEGKPSPAAADHSGHAH